VGDLSARNFGLLIAYVIPGFVVLWGLSFVSPTIAAWLSGAGASGPTVGGFLYVFLASIAGGMTASAFRWATLDTVHHRTGVRLPLLNFAAINEKLSGFERVVQDHYQYYQFYGNTMVALLVSYPLWRASGEGGGLLTDFAALTLLCVFFAGSRNALQVFYRRAVDLLGESEGSHDERIGRRQTLPPGAEDDTSSGE
jgi:hypothetical protein